MIIHVSTKSADYWAGDTLGDETSTSSGIDQNIQVDVAGYLYIPTQKDTMNRSESTRSYLTASSKPLTTNKKSMHLRLNYQPVHIQQPMDLV